MRCDRCGEDAVIHQPYAGTHLCEEHLRRSITKRVRRRIRTDALLDADPSPEEPARWVIGLSGGKDSAVLATILSDTFTTDPRIDLLALTIDEGIDGYRDKSVEACRELAAQLDLEHEIVGYEEEFDVRMDDVATNDRATLAPCAYCGVFRRDVLDHHAKRLDADLLLTGHNLDDEAQTALMNVLSGDVDQMAKHFRASLAPLSARRQQENFIPRAKPLRDIPEREVALFGHTAELPMHFAECPHSSEAFRGEIQDILLRLEDGHPGTRHSIMAGYEQVAELLSKSMHGGQSPDLHPCTRCGSMTNNELCRPCEMLDAISAGA